MSVKSRLASGDRGIRQALDKFRPFLGAPLFITYAVAVSSCWANDASRFVWHPPREASVPPDAASVWETLGAHLSRVDRGLTVLRYDYRWIDVAQSPPERGTLDECQRRLRQARATLTLAKEDAFFEGMVGLLERLDQRLKSAEVVAADIDQGRAVTAEQRDVLRVSHGYVKRACRIMRNFEAVAAEVKSSEAYRRAPQRYDLRPALRGTRPACILEPQRESPPQQQILPHQFGALLIALSALDDRQMTDLARRIIEDEMTRVVEIQLRREAEFVDPVFYILAESRVQLPDDTEKHVLLPLKQTFERVNIEDTKQLFKSVFGAQSDASLVVHTTLMAEAPVTKEFSITAFDSRLAFFAAQPSDGQECTEIEFALGLELTFYKKDSQGLRDFAYRSAAQKRTESALEITKQGTVTRTHDLLAGLLTAGPSSLTPPGTHQATETHQDLCAPSKIRFTE